MRTGGKTILWDFLRSCVIMASGIVRAWNELKPEERDRHCILPEELQGGLWGREIEDGRVDTENRE